ncbi:MAG: STAS domain-containing protein [Chitinispirillaceae bacterium]|nr:STAS domain-containing protein [Chitinispirillaceae bacterium]
MVITESVSQGWHIIQLEGKFIVRNLTVIRKAFERAERESIPGIAIDLSGVSQVDSSAITILMNFQRRVIQKDGLLVLFGLRSDITEIFSIVGIDKLFRICRDREDFETLYVHQ